jgi:hypothetical protein
MLIVDSLELRDEGKKPEKHVVSDENNVVPPFGRGPGGIARLAWMSVRRQTFSCLNAVLHAIRG